MKKHRLLFFPVVLFFFGSQPQVLLAGSVTGLSNSNGVINCDARRSNGDASWCTAEAADQIFQNCFVVIRSKSDMQRNQCDWQSCGPVAFVGEKAKINGNNVEEYGIQTPHSDAQNPPPNWEYDPTTGTVLPKFPFVRNYMKISDFVTARDKCSTDSSSNDVQSTICPIDKALFESNTYFACLKKFHNGRLGNNL